MPSFDYQLFLRWLVRRWNKALRDAVRVHDGDSPCMLEYWAYPLNGVDVPCATGPRHFQYRLLRATAKFPKFLACSDQRALGKSCGIGEFMASCQDNNQLGLRRGTAQDRERAHIRSIFFSAFAMGPATASTGTGGRPNSISVTPPTPSLTASGARRWPGRGPSRCS